MADYPVTDIHVSSSMQPVTDNGVNIGPNGSVRVASNNTAYDSYIFSIVHSLVTADIKDSIVEHYDNHRSLTFNYDCDMDNNTYLCFYMSEPSTTWVAEDVWHVQTNMNGH